MTVDYIGNGEVSTSGDRPPGQGVATSPVSDHLPFMTPAPEGLFLQATPATGWRFVGWFSSTAQVDDAAASECHASDAKAASTDIHAPASGFDVYCVSRFEEVP